MTTEVRHDITGLIIIRAEFDRRDPRGCPQHCKLPASDDSMRQFRYELVDKWQRTQR